MTWLARWLCRKKGHVPSGSNPWICERCGVTRHSLHQNFPPV